MSYVRTFIFCSYLTIAFSMQLAATSLVEVVTILSRYASNPQQVGEVAPLSRKAGMQLARSVKQDAYVPSQYYLEIGGGCGAITACIAHYLRPQDHLDVIEICPKMCEFLRNRFKDYRNIAIHCCSVLDWHPGKRYDAIISTLPFNSLGTVFTRKFLDYLPEVCKKETVFSYVEYPIVRQMLQHFYGTNRKNEFRGVQAILKDFRQTRLQGQKTVYFNVPPVTIYHLSMSA